MTAHPPPPTTPTTPVTPATLKPPGASPQRSLARSIALAPTPLGPHRLLHRLAPTAACTAWPAPPGPYRLLHGLARTWSAPCQPGGGWPAGARRCKRRGHPNPWCHPWCAASSAGQPIFFNCPGSDFGTPGWPKSDSSRKFMQISLIFIIFRPTF